jgi:hypothetical protein
VTGTIERAAQLEHRLGQHGRFALRLPAGSASIRAVDGDTARVRDLDGRPLGERFDIRRADGALELVAKGRFRGINLQIGNWSLGDSDIELDIEIPRSTSVAVDVASADISVTGVSGPGRYRTASGDLILQDIAGNVEWEGVSADVRVDAVAGLEIAGKTISGDVSIRAPRLTRLELSTTSGDIKLDADLTGKGPFAIRSISGDVTMVARGAIAVEAQSVTGDLTSELQAKFESGPGRRTLSIGKGATPLAFKSVSGDLQVVEPRTTAPPTPPSAPAAPTPPMPAFAAEPAAAPAPETPELATARLDILRALERGELDVETAMTRLAALEVA